MDEDMMIQELREEHLEQVVGGYGGHSRGTNFLQTANGTNSTLSNMIPPALTLPSAAMLSPDATTTTTPMTTTTPGNINLSLTKYITTNTTNNQAQSTQFPTHNSSTAPGQTTTP
jgi:hypothetical protein